MIHLAVASARALPARAVKARTRPLSLECGEFYLLALEAHAVSQLRCVHVSLELFLFCLFVGPGSVSPWTHLRPPQARSPRFAELMEDRFELAETSAEVAEDARKALLALNDKESELLDLCTTAGAPPWMALLGPFWRVKAGEAAPVAKALERFKQAAEAEAHLLMSATGDESEQHVDDEASRGLLQAMRKYHLRVAKAADACLHGLEPPSGESDQISPLSSPRGSPSPSLSNSLANVALSRGRQPTAEEGKEPAVVRLASKGVGLRREDSAKIPPSEDAAEPAAQLWLPKSPRARDDSLRKSRSPENVAGDGGLVAPVPPPKPSALRKSEVPKGDRRSENVLSRYSDEAVPSPDPGPALGSSHPGQFKVQGRKDSLSPPVSPRLALPTSPPPEIPVRPRALSGSSATLSIPALRPSPREDAAQAAPRSPRQTEDGAGDGPPQEPVVSRQPRSPRPVPAVPVLPANGERSLAQSSPGVVGAGPDRQQSSELTKSGAAAVGEKPAAAGRGVGMGRHMSPRKQRPTEVQGVPSNTVTLAVVPAPFHLAPYHEPKCLGDLAAEDLAANPPVKWEVQRKTRLVLQPCVLRLDDAQLTVYDVKQQTSTTRPFGQIPKATRSNRNPRKLKVWGLESCDRFVFASGKAREQFLEMLWARRKVVPSTKLWCEPLELFIGELFRCVTGGWERCPTDSFLSLSLSLVGLLWQALGTWARRVRPRQLVRGCSLVDLICT
jgi:hypothetical protein